MSTKKIPTGQEPPSKPDDNAISEGENLASGKSLEKKANEAQHNRREIARDVIAWWLRIGIRLGAILIMIAGAILFDHVFGPKSWRYLI